MALYILQNGQRIGPYSDEEIAARVETGVVAVTDLVWEEGMAECLPLEQVRGIKHSLVDEGGVKTPAQIPPPIPPTSTVSGLSRSRRLAPDVTLPKGPPPLPTQVSRSGKTTQGYPVKLTPARENSSLKPPMRTVRKVLLFAGSGCLLLLLGFVGIIVLGAFLSGGNAQKQEPLADPKTPESPTQNKSLADLALDAVVKAIPGAVADSMMTDAERSARTQSLILGVWQGTNDPEKYANMKFAEREQTEFRADGTFRGGDGVSNGKYSISEDGRTVELHWGGIIGGLGKLLGDKEPDRWTIISISKEEMVTNQPLTWWYRRVR